MAIHLVAPLAMVAAAAASWGSSLGIRELRERALEVFALLRFEFIYPPGISREGLVDECCEQLLDLGLIEAVERSEEGAAARAEADPGSGGPSVRGEVLAVPAEARSALGSLRRIVEPFLDAYWTVACTLDAISGGRIPKPELLHMVRNTWGRLYLLGLLKHREAGSLASFRNALGWMKEEGYLQEEEVLGGKEKGSSRGGPLLVLSEDPDELARRRALRSWLAELR